MATIKISIDLFVSILCDGHCLLYLENDDTCVGGTPSPLVRARREHGLLQNIALEASGFSS